MTMDDKFPIDLSLTEVSLVMAAVKTVILTGQSKNHTQELNRIHDYLMETSLNQIKEVKKNEN